MVVPLRIFFVAVLASIVGTTTWASLQAPLLGMPRELATHPWFIATLVDAYLGFLTFYAWVAWRDRHWLSRAAWLVAILLLGNVAMAAYALERLFQVPTHATVGEIFLERRTSASWLGAALAAAGILTWVSLA
ncbi:DUF1475 family protein [Nibricoccus sp. IMCC34717]|uniref:DUF1475 family protein n=1 Tax=Nibricoccus sp. IMCC34717 TaxID=3034021 RepID=UPI00384C7E1C